MSSHRKLQEAAFFIELLHALQERGSSLTHLDDSEAEASFLYAAILNAFYSVVEVMRKEGHDTRPFKARYPMIYADGSKGGERAKTVHLSHTEVDLAGYEPPSGDQVVLTFRRPPKLFPPPPKVPGRVDLVFKPEYYFYVELLGRRVNALEFCERHCSELHAYNAAATAA
ncbi:MAG: hypothetical protein IPH35_04770 [Rhodoferax sp.]|nr:hypothetical protein [Rhodoferax sp.]